MIAAPIDNCDALKYVEGIFAEIAIPSTSLLFLFRVKAIYNHLNIITTFFGIMWLSIAGLSILIMLGITRGKHFGWFFYDDVHNYSVDRIPYTRHCTEGLAHQYTMVPIIVTAAYDTLIFLAVSYRLVTLNGKWHMERTGQVILHR